MPLAIFLIASSVIGMMPEGLLIIAPFMIIRKFSGGYHARHAYIGGDPVRGDEKVDFAQN